MDYRGRSMESPGYSSEASDIEYSSDGDQQDIKTSLESCLTEVKTKGSFVTAGRCSGSPLPGLSVAEVDLIGLPLNDPTAKAIVEVCHQAPFGRGLISCHVAHRINELTTI